MTGENFRNELDGRYRNEGGSRSLTGAKESIFDYAGDESVMRWLLRTEGFSNP